MPYSLETHKEARISHSSCEAEVKATDECIKNVQKYHHILSDLQLLDTLPTNVYSFSTKGMHHVNICENAASEAQLMNEVSTQHIPGPCNPAD